MPIKVVKLKAYLKWLGKCLPNSSDSVNISSVLEFGFSLGDSNLIIEKANGSESSHFREWIHSGV